MHPFIVVVMGVAGCGKSTVGQRLAASRGVEFVEGDEFHPPGNVQKMAAGIALADEDRVDWLHALAARLALARQAGVGLVLSCSALKRSYREVLRAGAPDLILVHLTGTPAVVAQRIAARTAHYMPPALLDSQYEILEPPQADELALSFDIGDPPERIAERIARRLGALPDRGFP